MTPVLVVVVRFGTSSSARVSFELGPFLSHESTALTLITASLAQLFTIRFAVSDELVFVKYTPCVSSTVMV